VASPARPPSFPVSRLTLINFLTNRAASGAGSLSLRSYASGAKAISSIIASARASATSYGLPLPALLSRLAPSWDLSDPDIKRLCKAGSLAGAPARAPATQPLLPHHVASWCSLHERSLDTDWPTLALAALLWIGLSLGARGGELASLDVSDVRRTSIAAPDDAIPIAAFEITLRDRKNSTPRHEPARIAATNSQPANPISPFRLIARWLDRRSSLLTSAGLPAQIINGPLFWAPTNRLGAPVRALIDGDIRHALRGVADDLGLPADLSFGAKSLRVGAASALAASGASEAVIKAQCGWRSSAAVAHYIASSTGLTSGWIDALAASSAVHRPIASAPQSPLRHPRGSSMGLPSPPAHGPLPRAALTSATPASHSSSAPARTASPASPSPGAPARTSSRPVRSPRLPSRYL